MYLKIHQSPNGEVVAVCDEDLIGKTLEDARHTLKITEHFYKGESKEEEDILEMLQNTQNMNFMGEKAVRLGIKAKKILPENVRVIAGVPHAQVYA